MTRALALKDLKRSGLNDADYKHADYKVLTREQTQELTGFHASAYQMPYYDVHGKKTEFWRVRYLEPIKGKFGAVRKKPPRYSQAIGTLPRFYFPKRVNWSTIAADTSESLLITEGEKKAEKACKDGLPCIAVGGVWAWRSKKHNLPSIPDFKVIKWKGRTVYLVFDNDLMTNPLVIGALGALSHELHARGAKVIVKHLPKGPGKIGLDDYLLSRSVKGFMRLEETDYSESKMLWELNERLAVIGKVNAIWDFEHRTMYPTRQSLMINFGNLKYKVAKANGEGFTEKYAAEQWVAWEHRRHYKDIGYFPGGEPVVENKINTWVPYPIEPADGPIKPFLDLVDYLFEGEPKLKAWFLQWLAYPLQNPGEKVLTAVLLHSRRQGVGKSFIGYLMGDIYGSNFNVVGQDELTSKYNDWVVSKQFILGEEITGNNSRREADRLKNIITREKLNVSIKYQPGYVMQDCANFLFTSNHVDALFLDDYDRRTVVHEIAGAPKPDAFYARIDAWRNKYKGVTLFHYLLNVDLEGFNPKARAPSSAAKDAMINASKSALDLFADDVLNSPDSVLRLRSKVVEDELMTLGQLTSFANSLPGASNHSPPAVSKALRRVGFREYTVFTCDGTKRFWAIRNASYWEHRTTKEMANYYEQVTYSQTDKLGKER